jgi:hypothetical protein
LRHADFDSRRWKAAAPIMLIGLIRCWATGATRRVRRRRRRVSGRTTSSTPSSRTACSSRSATTTRFRSGMQQESRGCVRM